MDTRSQILIHMREIIDSMDSLSSRDVIWKCQFLLCDISDLIENETPNY